MAQIVVTDNALANTERAFEFLAERDPYAASAAGKVIYDALSILAQHPLVGRAIEGPFRELIISYGKSGHVALYRYRPERDEVRVLALRHQRELDYPG